MTSYVKRIAVLLGALLLLMVPMLMTSPQKSIHVRNESGASVWCGPAKTYDVVELQFTHSMFGGYVKERWLITPDNRLDRDRFVTENAAAAEYYATDGSSYRADDGFVVPGEPLQQSELVIRVDSRGNHYLRVDNHTIHLAGIVHESTQVRISVESGNCG